MEFIKLLALCTTILVKAERYQEKILIKKRICNFSRMVKNLCVYNNSCYFITYLLFKRPNTKHPWPIGFRIVYSVLSAVYTSNILKRTTSFSCLRLINVVFFFYFPFLWAPYIHYRPTWFITTERRAEKVSEKQIVSVIDMACLSAVAIATHGANEKCARKRRLINFFFSIEAYKILLRSNSLFLCRMPLFFLFS